MTSHLLSFLGRWTVIAFAALLAPSPVAAAASRARVSRVVIKKSEHTMQLLGSGSSTDGVAREQTVAFYKVAIGPGGSGPKQREGDRVTPVGRYHVTMHQPSQYKIFLRLDYPNVEDHRRFSASKERGQLPKDARIGGDIGIHGPPVAFDGEVKSKLKEHDWTLGCIALDDDEISEVARLVPDGTPVDIED